MKEKRLYIHEVGAGNKGGGGDRQQGGKQIRFWLTLVVLSFYLLIPLVASDASRIGWGFSNILSGSIAWVHYYSNFESESIGGCIGGHLSETVLKKKASLV